MKREDLDEFVACFGAGNRHARKAKWPAERDEKAGTGPGGRWRAYDYDELAKRDKVSLDPRGRVELRRVGFANDDVAIRRDGAQKLVELLHCGHAASLLVPSVSVS